MMREFFGGWKRKVGVVTLVMACVCALGWIWSIKGAPKATIPTKFEIELVRSGIHVLLSQQTNSVAAMIKYGDRTEARYEVNDMIDLTIPYWSIVIPLTLFSAYLLLSRQSPRTR